MTEFQQLVRDFNVAVSSPRNPDLRASLISEEAKETMDAIMASDPIATIDGLCDLLYVTYGAGDCFDIILETSLSDMELADRPLGWGKMQNGLPMFERAVIRAIEAIKNLPEPLYADFLRTTPNTLKFNLETLANRCWAIASQGLALDLRPFFHEVHRTNMHKLTGPKREDGKQLKPPDWKPPRIAEMYEALGKREL